MQTNCENEGRPGRLRAKLTAFHQRFLWRRALAHRWSSVAWGGVVHALTGKTPPRSHASLYDLFILSGGRANDRLAGTIRRIHPPYSLPSASGVLGDLNKQELDRINSALINDGYYVFENCLSDDFCQRIIDRTLQLQCRMYGDEVQAQGGSKTGRYDRIAPAAAKYLVTEDDTTDIPEVQELISDPSLITVAQNYLAAKPIFSGISLWWSPSVKEEPDDEAAQRFHWDMERIRWIRFFIYLTDVGPENGPHCFIRGTHKTGGIPADLLARGYTRIDDEEILDRVGPQEYREFIGRRGTIIVEDSRGFHKGAAPKKDDRLLLAFELSTTTFGANKRHRIRNIHVPRFSEFARRFPRVYSNFDFDPGLLAR